LFRINQSNVRLIIREKAEKNENKNIGNCIEEIFGEAKRRFNFNRVMTQGCDTSETKIAITFLMMNICPLLRNGYRLSQTGNKVMLGCPF
jgi:transposase, IS5 family